MKVVSPLVSIVDDDESVRESLPDLLREFGFRAEAFSSAEAFLVSGNLDETACLILDVTMPGMSGPELQRQLTLSGQAIPIVYITAHGGESLRPRLLAGGAVECLSKPFSDTALREALNSAFQTG
jgi:FixJ family two-component response regulator